jgi:hypothetical protein
MMSRATRRLWVACLAGALVLLGAPAWGSDQHNEAADFMDGTRKTLSVWHHVPFYAGGDIAQYETTMAQSRDTVRKGLFDELTRALSTLTQAGAKPELLIEPMSNILLMMDMMHDLHKARDLQRIDFSIESQFKAALDALYIGNDIRPAERHIQFSRGTDTPFLSSYINGKSPITASPGKPGRGEQSIRAALSLRDQIDYLAYGSFSNLGGNNFQLTLHLQNVQTGAVHSLMSRGPLGAATDLLAQSMFDFFQKNAYPSWEAPMQQLEWLAMPGNPSRNELTSSSFGYSFQEAMNYCADRGYRLPYARELLSAETGGPYKTSGIGHLRFDMNYPVLDMRHLHEQYMLRLGPERSMATQLHAVTALTGKGIFWCVKGAPSRKIMTYEFLWRLHRQHRSGDGSNKELFAAVESLRFELGDVDAGSSHYNNRSTGNMFEKIQRFYTMEAAVAALRRHGIVIELPEPVRPR